MSKMNPMLRKSTSTVLEHAGPAGKIENVGDRFLEAEKLDINRVFKVIDTDNSGFIDATELKQVLKDLGFENNALAACDRVFDNLGTGAEKISARTFYEIMSRKLDSKSKDEEITACFYQFLQTIHSSEPQKKITPEILQSVARNLGETVDLETAKLMIREFKTKGKQEDTIDIDEFRKIMITDLQTNANEAGSPKSKH